MASQTLRIEGLDELKQKLADIPRSLRRKVFRQALVSGATIIRDEARRYAPLLKSNRVNRKVGTLRKSIVVRTSKIATRSGDVGVFVNVRPAKGAVYKKGVLVKESQRGKDSDKDPYYWQWLEFGRKRNVFYKMSNKTKRIRKFVVGRILPFSFLQNASEKLPEALGAFEMKLSSWFDQVNSTGNTKP